MASILYKHQNISTSLSFISNRYIFRKSSLNFRFFSTLINGYGIPSTCLFFTNFDFRISSNLSTGLNNRRNVHINSIINFCLKDSSHILHLKAKQDSSSNRQFSSTGSGDGGTPIDLNSETVIIKKLPRRIVKRLQKQGVTQEEFLSKLNMASADTDKKQNLDEILKSMSTEPNYLSEMDNFPSDVERHKRWEKQKRLASQTSPSTTSIVLFPGQGSQFVGMGKKLLKFPRVQDLYEEASSLLGYDLFNLCINGPKSDLDKTVYCQPAVVITSLAALEKLREEHPQAVEKCVSTAGFSVGEFSALVFSGVLSFPDAVKLVKIRAEAMQRASEVVGSSMLSVFLAHDSNLSLAIKTAKEFCHERRGIESPVCVVANYLFPECKVIAGHEEAIEFIAANAKEFNILRTKRLPVSGAFHTNLMESAVQPLQRALNGMKVGTPKFTVYSNVTNAPYHQKTNFAHMLGQQLVKPVKWEQIMHVIYSRSQGVDFPNTYEVGPGKQMGTFLKQVNLQAHKLYHNVEV